MYFKNMDEVSFENSEVMKEAVNILKRQEIKKAHERALEVVEGEFEIKMPEESVESFEEDCEDSPIGFEADFELINDLNAVANECVNAEVKYSIERASQSIVAGYHAGETLVKLADTLDTLGRSTVANSVDKVIKKHAQRTSWKNWDPKVKEAFYTMTNDPSRGLNGLYTIKEIQKIQTKLGLRPDGVWGPASFNAANARTKRSDGFITNDDFDKLFAEQQQPAETSTELEKIVENSTILKTLKQYFPSTFDLVKNIKLPNIQKIQDQGIKARELNAIETELQKAMNQWTALSKITGPATFIPYVKEYAAGTMPEDKIPESIKRALPTTQEAKELLKTFTQEIK